MSNNPRAQCYCLLIAMLSIQARSVSVEGRDNPTDTMPRHYLPPIQGPDHSVAVTPAAHAVPAGENLVAAGSTIMRKESALMSDAKPLHAENHHAVQFAPVAGSHGPLVHKAVKTGMWKSSFTAMKQDRRHGSTPAEEALMAGGCVVPMWDPNEYGAVHMCEEGSAASLTMLLDGEDVGVIPTGGKCTVMCPKWHQAPDPTSLSCREFTWHTEAGPVADVACFVSHKVLFGVLFLIMSCCCGGCFAVYQTGKKRGHHPGPHGNFHPGFQQQHHGQGGPGLHPQHHQGPPPGYGQSPYGQPPPMQGAAGQPPAYGQQMGLQQGQQQGQPPAQQ